MTGVTRRWKYWVSPELKVRVEHWGQWIWLELKYSVPSIVINSVSARNWKSAN